MNYNNNSYYEAPFDDQADAEEFQAEVDYEMKHGNYPYTEENILEAINDDGLIECLPTLATLLANGQTAEAGVVLSSTLYTYWEKRTQREVQESI